MALFTSLLKTIKSSKKLASKAFKVDNIKIVNSENSKANKTIINLFRNLMHISNIRTIREHIFLILDAKKTLNQL